MTMVTEYGESALEQFIDGYVECLFWQGQDWSVVDDVNVHNPDPLDENYSVDDLADEAWASIREDCEAFVTDNFADLDTLVDDQGATWEGHGHDFCLTRNGHGTGFWDRGYGERGNRLSDAARVYGDSGEYVGDDGKVYV